MPFYEYQCKSCGHQLEAMQKVSEPPLKKCPDCGKSQLQRLMSAPVFRLKGSGWYETDFKDDKDKKRNLVDKEAPQDGGAKGADAKGADAPTEVKDDAKAADSAATEGAKPKEKTADKPPAAKAAATAKSRGGKKVDLKRGKRAVKKPAPKAKRRR